MTRREMTVQVEDAGDLAAVGDAYDRLMYSGEPSTLRVHLAPGTYTKHNLQLIEDDEEGQVEVHLIGEGEVRWESGQLTVEGERVSLTGISFVGGRPGRHLLRLAARKAISMDQVLIAGNTGGRKANVPLVLLGALGPGVALDVRGLQMIGNQGAPGGAGLSLETPGRADFARATFSDVLWVDNHFARDLSAPGTHAVELRDSVWQCSTELLWLPLDGASLRVSGSLLELPSARGALPVEPLIVVLSDTEVRLRDGGHEAPEAWSMDRAPAPAHEANLSALSATARQGRRQQIVEARRLLE